jgi:hypothetical protein
MQQRRMERIRERLGFTNETEWAAVQPMLQKVTDAQLEVFVMGAGMAGAFGRGGGGGGGGGGGRGGGQGQANPELEALQRALESNAPAAQVKAALDRYRAVRKEKEATLTKAQEDLRQVLSAKQEGEAVVLGLVN